MHLPNYKNGSIVNLMATLARAFGGRTPYQPLTGLDKNIFSGKNVVLMVIDALGYEFFKKYGRGSFLEENLKQKITSVFPSTTATGVTTFMSGVPAQQHGLTGWYMNLKELGLVVRILPFTTRAGHVSLGDKGLQFKNIFPEKSFFKKIKAVGYAVQHQDYADSQYSLALTEGAKRLPFNSPDSFFKTIKQALAQPTRRKFIYAYWDGLDVACHKYGCASTQAEKHFKNLDKKIEAFAKTLKNTVLIVTADHGQIDVPKNKAIDIKDYPEFVRMLALPLCGEHRLAYCYVKSGMAERFENYVKKNFKKYCDIFKSQKLIEKKFFGLFKPCPELFDRVGDYTLIMKSDYNINDFLAGEERIIPKGNHGGVSREEMFVPLVIIKN